jgi:hypothetical protein
MAKKAMAVRVPKKDLMEEKLARILGENSQFQMRLSPTGAPMAVRNILKTR